MRSTSPWKDVVFMRWLLRPKTFHVSAWSLDSQTNPKATPEFSQVIVSCLWFRFNIGQKTWKWQNCLANFRISTNKNNCLHFLGLICIHIFFFLYAGEWFSMIPIMKWKNFEKLTFRLNDCFYGNFFKNIIVAILKILVDMCIYEIQDWFKNVFRVFWNMFQKSKPYKRNVNLWSTEKKLWYSSLCRMKKSVEDDNIYFTEWLIFYSVINQKERNSSMFAYMCITNIYANAISQVLLSIVCLH